MSECDVIVWCHVNHGNKTIVNQKVAVLFQWTKHNTAKTWLAFHIIVTPSFYN